MTNRVRLTPAAATRFPDLAGREGIRVSTDRGDPLLTWVLIVWPDPRGAAYEPRHTWLPPGDVEAAEDEGGLPSLDPSDPNAPTP